MKKRAFIILIVSLCTAHKNSHEESMNTYTVHGQMRTQEKQQRVTVADYA